MSDRNNDGVWAKIDKSSELLVRMIVITAVMVCLVGLIICFFEFIQNMKKFSDNYERALAVAVSSVEETTENAPIMDNEEDSEFADADELAESSNTGVEVQQVITHLENMLAIQENGLTNNLMSFVYGILSTIIVGLCARYLEQNRNRASDAEKCAETAKNSAETAEKSAETAKESMEYFQSERKKLDDSLLKTDEQYFLLKPRMDILNVRMALAGDLSGQSIVSSTDNLVRLKEDVKLLNDNIPHVFQVRLLDELREELLLLESVFIRIKNDAEKKPEMYKNKKTFADVVITAANRDIQWIDEMIKKCNQIPRNPTP